MNCRKNAKIKIKVYQSVHSDLNDMEKIGNPPLFPANSLGHWPLGDMAVIDNRKLVILKHISEIDVVSISRKMSLRWIPQDLIDDYSTLVQVMAWCHQATSHYLSPCWPRTRSPYGVSITRPKLIIMNEVTKWLCACQISPGFPSNLCQSQITEYCFIDLKIAGLDAISSMWSIRYSWS